MAIAKRNIIIGCVIGLIVVVALLVPYLLSLPLPDFMVRILKQDIISSHETNSALSVANGRLVFARNGDIYSIAFDGTDLRQLTNNPNGEWSPAYSKDGELICFERQFQLSQSEKDIPYDYNGIIVMDANGNNQYEVVKGRDHILNEDPAFSPNGERIAFLHLDTRPLNQREPGSTRSVCEINKDGTGLREFGIEMSTPTYSADGSLIYVWDVAAIRSIARKSGQLQFVGKLPSDSYSIRYSPDSKQVVYIGLDAIDRMQNPYLYQIYTASIDGSNVKKLTHDSGVKHNPVFTPDGSEIVFLQEQRGKKIIKRMNVDGTNIRTIFEW